MPAPKRRRRLLLALLLIPLAAALFFAVSPEARLAAVEQVRPDPVFERFQVLDAEYKRDYHSKTRLEQLQADAAHKLEIAKLTPEQQRAYQKARMLTAFRQHRERLYNYHNMSAAEKIAFLDHQIDEDEEAGARTEAARRKRKNLPPAPPKPLAAKPAVSKIGVAAKPATPLLPPAEPPAESGVTTPEEKMLSSNFIRDRSARRVERGLEPDDNRQN